MTSSVPSESVFKKRTRAVRTASLNLFSSKKEVLPEVAACGVCCWSGGEGLLARMIGLSSELLESELKIATSCGCPGGSCCCCRIILPRLWGGLRGSGSESEPLESELKTGGAFGRGFLVISSGGFTIAGVGCTALPAASSASLVWPGPHCTTWLGVASTGGWARNLAPRPSAPGGFGRCRCRATTAMRPPALLVSLVSSSSSSSSALCQKSDGESQHARSRGWSASASVLGSDPATAAGLT
mmetsp:Transcript_43462/g.125478  ORF Transcript_43462/g.125478 Transcript_43462/m.125478 type:complete len:242 (-) Transcript_43462:690-1415(-)